MITKLTSVEEVEQRSKFSGFVFQFYRFGPFGKLSGWRKQFVCLAPTGGEAADGLSLLFFTPEAGNNLQVRFRTELALEQGCEARENFDPTRDHTFLVITSKQQLRLQATSGARATAGWARCPPSSRSRWARACWSRRRSCCGWAPRGRAGRGVRGDRGGGGGQLPRLDRVAEARLPLQLLRGACVRRGRTLDIECDQQSTRDDWVSALGAFLAGGEREVPRMRQETLSAPSVDLDELVEQSRRLRPPPRAGAKKNTLEANGAEFFKAETAPRGPVSREDMDLVLTHPKFRHDKRAFELVEYAPAAFRELRNGWGVTDTRLLESVGALSGDGAVGDGKSGMLFFFSADRHFVLKTVKPNEMQVLSDFLRAYIRHMLDNPDSLICRFFGLYTFKFPGQQSINLVCMQNSFDTRLVLHEKYDLKGSTRNRWCTPRFGAVLKDLNFGTSKLFLDAADRLALLEQCERDTLLMEQFNVMDYSLLLGVHKAEPDEKGRRNLVLLAMANQLEPEHVKPTRWQRDFGGVEGFNPDSQAPEVYIMCVIDLLQAYDLGKKAENLIKSQLTEVVSEISSVNPRTYRARFLAYLAKIIVGTPGQNAQIQAQRKEIKLRVFANAGGRPTTVPRAPAPQAAVRPMLPARASAMPRLPLSRAAGGGSLDEDQLKTEIQRAVLEAQETKAHMDSGGGESYTEQLEDGTEITILDNGGFIQRSPNGTVIHMAPDGSKTQTDPDGSTIHVSAEGEITCRLPDGTEIVHLDDVDTNVVDLQRNPTAAPSRRGRTDADPAQPGRARIETYPNGDSAPSSPTAWSWSRWARARPTRGTRTRSSPPSPTAACCQEDKSDGMIIRTFADHSELHTFPDGTVIEHLPSGYSKQTNRDDTVIETFPDGRVVQTDRHGKVVLESNI
ncbi:hypothetical protein BASA81_012718 [Batrachochytrium salamandrivorans]|nr:hypothetical protein BASA81_012718 [Batrachochytrium salamandrivorans]